MLPSLLTHKNYSPKFQAHKLKASLKVGKAPFNKLPLSLKVNQLLHPNLNLETKQLLGENSNTTKQKKHYMISI